MSEPTSTGAEVYTTGQVAALCGVKTITVVRWIKRGELDAYALPGRGDRRIPRDALLEFLEKNKLPIPPGLEGHSPGVLILGRPALARRRMMQTLKSRKISCTLLSDGFQAGMEISAHPPDLLIVDLSCPDPDGLAVIRWIRQSGEHRGLLIAAVEAKTDSKAKTARDAGADEAFLKDIAPLPLAGLLGRAAARGAHSAFA